MTLNKPVFYDTDCLECFLFVDAGHILEKLFTKIVIPEQVYNELMDNDELPEWIDSDLSAYDIVYDKLLGNN